MDKRILRKVQLNELEILKEVDRICKKNNIRYYLVGGTLLGAIRHDGFIPWDDDIDIAMPREDYDKFCKLCDKELNEEMYLHGLTTDKNYWLPFSKIRLKNTEYIEENISNLNLKTGIYIDIFPFDYAKKEVYFLKTVRTFFIKKISAVIRFKNGFKPTHTKGKVITAILKPISSYRLSLIRDWLMKRENKHKNQCSYYVNYGSNYNTNKQTIPINCYEPSNKHIFEGIKFVIPNNYDYVLKRIYGNKYMQLPPKEKRITHNPEKIRFKDGMVISFKDN